MPTIEDKDHEAFIRNQTAHVINPVKVLPGDFTAKVCKADIFE
jgi:hypothetical protein